MRFILVVGLVTCGKFFTTFAGLVTFVEITTSVAETVVLLTCTAEYVRLFSRQRCAHKSGVSELKRPSGLEERNG